MITKFKHPEIREREMFLGNFTIGGFLKISHKTKRKGTTPYDTNGNEIEGSRLYPVFVSRIEYNRNAEEVNIFRKRVGFDLIDLV